MTSLDDAGRRYGCVMNCTGVWAGALAQDTAVFPIRGQIISATRPASLSLSVLDMDGLFVVCRTEDCIIGGANDDGCWETGLREKDRETLLTRVRKLCAALTEPEIIEERVGLRPGRSSVRVEREIRNGYVLVHNYGHGGAGFTLSWGCAEEVTALVASS